MKSNGLCIVAMTVAALVFGAAAVAQPASPEAKANAAKAARELDAARVQLMSELRKHLVGSLRDPESARLRGEFLSEAEEGQNATSLCGEVNAKNAYGGYVGFGRFIATTDGLLVMEAQGPAQAFPHIWQVWCARPMR